eukprot:COSAG02_NODE_4976_length_4763_cov_57.094554_5_plen_40_part_00
MVLACCPVDMAATGRREEWLWVVLMLIASMCAAQQKGIV